MYDCPAWADPVGTGDDPYETLPVYWYVLVGIVDPVRDDALVAQDWEQVKACLDQEPVPPPEATWIWNMRWRKTIALAWQMMQEHHRRQTIRRQRTR